jgi:hypothetical protein
LKDELGVEMEEREEEGGKPVTPAEEVEEDEWEWRERGEGRMGVVIDWERGRGEERWAEEAREEPKEDRLERVEEAAIGNDSTEFVTRSTLNMKPAG